MQDLLATLQDMVMRVPLVMGVFHRVEIKEIIIKEKEVDKTKEEIKVKETKGKGALGD